MKNEDLKPAAESQNSPAICKSAAAKTSRAKAVTSLSMVLLFLFLGFSASMNAQSAKKKPLKKAEEKKVEACLISPPKQLPKLRSSGNILSANVKGAKSYLWSVAGDDWSIVSGQESNSIEFTAGSGSATFFLEIENEKGIVERCSIEVESLMD